MNPNVLVAAITALIVAGAITYQTHYIDKRIDDLRSYIEARFKAVQDRLDKIEKRLDR